MNALIVGAGAVGQVYGHHLALGGAKVTFLVKPKYRDAMAEGLTLYPLNRFPRTRPVRWDGYRVISDLEAVRQGRFDQIWLCMSSTALRGDWLEPTLKAAGRPTVVSLLPGPDDRAVLREHVPAKRLVQGGITLISYAAPLPGETRFPEPGMAYWFPPLAPSPFDGTAERVRPIVDTLRSGHQPATHVPGFAARAPLMVAATTPIWATLEAAGWSFAEVRRNGHLQRAAAAGREAVAAAAWAHGLTEPDGLSLYRAPLLRLILAATRLAPMDMETYLRVHFTKVGDQTRLHLEELLAHADAGGFAAPNLRELDRALPAWPGPAAA